MHEEKVRVRRHVVEQRRNKCGQTSDPSHAGGLSDRPLDFFADVRHDWRECRHDVRGGALYNGRRLDRRACRSGAWRIDLLYYKGGTPPGKKTALTHMTINLTVVVLDAVNIWLRTSGHESMKVPLSFRASAYAWSPCRGGSVPNGACLRRRRRRAE